MILDQLTTAVVIVLSDGRLVTMNAAAEQLFGVSEKQLFGHPLPGALPGLEGLSDLIQRTGCEQQTFGQDLAFSVPQQERDNIEVVCRLSPLGEEHVSIEFFDATHWRHIDREQALISQRGISRKMIGQLAHEVRNPLGGLRGAAQLLEKQLDSAELREFTRIIIGEADRLVALTDSLLGPLRRPDPAPLNVHELTERVTALVRNEMPPGVELYRDYDPSLPMTVLDRDQMMQALLNITRNAVEAVGSHGQIIVRSRALTGYVIDSVRHRLVISIEIEDDGPGIPADIGESAFFPLVTGRIGGTGLGLPLAQDLVRRNGGLIEYASEPTVFMIRLPVEV